ncbi:DUF1295 domain-containing protein [Candidatus Pacebacteria bacterium]|nr:DUF1295 domain-containing protein [Candidatus Paceibacterota bacterium]
MEVFLTAAIVILIFMTALFVVSVFIQRNDIADIAWGTGILIVGVVGYWHYSTVNPSSESVLPTILIVLYALWGLRLTYRIGKRNLSHNDEDPRYKRWRESWGAWFYPRSYLQVYLLQGLLMIVVGSPLLIVGATGAGMTTVSPLVYLGLVVWLIGYYFEVVGDYQLDQFIARKKAGQTDQKIMTEGLWRYTRHPNYFGEVTMWWGIWLMVATLPLGWVALISPVMITFLILKVSGVPLLEEQFAGEPEWEAYTQKTSRFFPMPPRDLESIK